jgi:chorismate mutase
MCKDEGRQDSGVGCQCSADNAEQTHEQNTDDGVDRELLARLLAEREELRAAIADIKQSPHSLSLKYTAEAMLDKLLVKIELS